MTKYLLELGIELRKDGLPHYRKSQLAYGERMRNGRVWPHLGEQQNFPPSEHDGLMNLYLWSRNQDGDVQGVFSFQTALDLWELSDVNPVKVHITVPPTFRKRAEAIPKSIILHKKNLKPAQVADFHGMKITTPVQTLLDVIEDGTLSPELIEQALIQARERGLVLEKDIRNHTELQKYLTRKK